MLCDLQNRVPSLQARAKQMELAWRRGAGQLINGLALGRLGQDRETRRACHEAAEGICPKCGMQLDLGCLFTNFLLCDMIIQDTTILMTQNKNQWPKHLLLLEASAGASSAFANRSLALAGLIRLHRRGCAASSRRRRGWPDRSAPPPGGQTLAATSGARQVPAHPPGGRARGPVG